MNAICHGMTSSDSHLSILQNSPCMSWNVMDHMEVICLEFRFKCPQKNKRYEEQVQQKNKHLPSLTFNLYQAWCPCQVNLRIGRRWNWNSGRIRCGLGWSKKDPTFSNKPSHYGWVKPGFHLWDDDGMFPLFIPARLVLPQTLRWGGFCLGATTAATKLAMADATLVPTSETTCGWGGWFSSRAEAILVNPENSIKFIW